MQMRTEDFVVKLILCITLLQFYSSLSQGEETQDKPFFYLDYVIPAKLFYLAG